MTEDMRDFARQLFADPSDGEAPAPPDSDSTDADEREFVRQLFTIHD